MRPLVRTPHVTACRLRSARRSHRMRKTHPLFPHGWKKYSQTMFHPGITFLSEALSCPVHIGSGTFPSRVAFLPIAVKTVHRPKGKSPDRNPRCFCRSSDPAFGSPKIPCETASKDFLYYSLKACATACSSASGLSAGAKRAIGSPFRSMRNLVKFHLILPGNFDFRYS